MSPIFPYIEGYAYDQNNKVLPNAVIRLRLKMNKASIYEIKADNNGYFKVLPKHVPIFPYYLEILPQSGGAITYTTSEFAKKNKEYLDNNKINLANTTREDKSLITGKLVQTASKTVSTNNKENAETVEKKSKSSTTLFLVFIIFIFLVLIGLTVFFIIKNKNNSPLPPQNF